MGRERERRCTTRATATSRRNGACAVGCVSSGPDPTQRRRQAHVSERDSGTRLRRLPHPGADDAVRWTHPHSCAVSPRISTSSTHPKPFCARALTSRTPTHKPPEAAPPRLQKRRQPFSHPRCSPAGSHVQRAAVEPTTRPRSAAPVVPCCPPPSTHPTHRTILPVWT